MSLRTWFESWFSRGPVAAPTPATIYRAGAMRVEKQAAAFVVTEVVGVDKVTGAELARAWTFVSIDELAKQMPEFVDVARELLAQVPVAPVES